MSMDFPASPAVNDIFTPPGVGYSYIWNGVTWKVYSAGGIPPGQVSHFAMQTPPAGWLECDGALVSRSTYAALFAAISTAFGVGDGSTTFGLPDFRGEFIRGWDHGKGTDSGRTFGSSQAQDYLAHNHTATTSGTDGTHTHGASAATNGEHRHTPGTASTYFVTATAAVTMDAVTGPATGSGALNFLSSSGTINEQSFTSLLGDHSHTITTNTVGSDHGHTITVGNRGGAETRPRNFALLVCIKT